MPNIFDYILLFFFGGNSYEECRWKFICNRQYFFHHFVVTVSRLFGILMAFFFTGLETFLQLICKLFGKTFLAMTYLLQLFGDLLTTTFWRLIDNNFLATYWQQLFGDDLCATTFWRLIDNNFLATFWQQLFGDLLTTTFWRRIDNNFLATYWQLILNNVFTTIWRLYWLWL